MTRVGQSQLRLAVSGDRDGLESGVDAEDAKETADVVANGFGAQVKLFGDLLGRASLLNKAKHLSLAGRQCRVRRCGLFVERPRDQSEDADDPFHP